MADGLLAGGSGFVHRTAHGPSSFAPVGTLMVRSFVVLWWHISLQLYWMAFPTRSLPGVVGVPTPPTQPLVASSTLSALMAILAC